MFRCWSRNLLGLSRAWRDAKYAWLWTVLGFRSRYSMPSSSIRSHRQVSSLKDGLIPGSSCQQETINLYLQKNKEKNMKKGHNLMTRRLSSPIKNTSGFIIFHSKFKSILTAVVNNWPVSPYDSRLSVDCRGCERPLLGKAKHRGWPIPIKALRNSKRLICSCTRDPPRTLEPSTSPELEISKEDNIQIIRTMDKED